MCFIDTRIGRLIQVQNWPQTLGVGTTTQLPIDTCRVGITISIIDTASLFTSWATVFDVLDNKNAMFVTAFNSPFQMTLAEYGSFIQRRLNIVNAGAATCVVNVVTYTLPEQYLALDPDDLISKYGKAGY
jgi:hypothetical protein